MILSFCSVSVAALNMGCYNINTAIKFLYVLLVVFSSSHLEALSTSRFWYLLQHITLLAVVPNMQASIGLWAFRWCLLFSFFNLHGLCFPLPCVSSNPFHYQVCRVGLSFLWLLQGFGGGFIMSLRISSFGSQAVHFMCRAWWCQRSFTGSSGRGATW